MSSKEGLGAAIETPNIHRQMAGSKVGTTKDREREHLSVLKSQEAGAASGHQAATAETTQSKPNS